MLPRRALEACGHSGARRDLQAKGAGFTPSRHLGLVQAMQNTPISRPSLKRAAQSVARSVDLKRLVALATPVAHGQTQTSVSPRPPKRSQSRADEAFAFAYPHLLQDWRTAGAELSFFSPLADEAPQESDLVFLPGGYPELHAARLAAAARFRAGVRAGRSKRSGLWRMRRLHGSGAPAD